MLCACCTCTRYEDDRDIQREMSSPPTSSSSTKMNRNNKIIAGDVDGMKEIKTSQKVSTKTNNKNGEIEHDWYAQFEDKPDEDAKPIIKVNPATIIIPSKMEIERDAYYRNACLLSEAKDTSFADDHWEPTAMTRTKHRDVWGYCYDYSKGLSGNDLQYCLLCAKSEFMKSGRYGNSDVNFRSVELPSAPMLLIAGTCSFCQTRLIPYWTCCMKATNNQQECSLPSYDF